MNALVSIDLAALTPATVFAPGGVEGIISKIEAEVSAEVFDIATAEGRERIKSVAYKVARSKTALDDMGKELVSGIKAQAAGIDADRRTIRDRLDALKERVRGPLTAWESAEKARVDGHEQALVAVIELGRQTAGKSCLALDGSMIAVSGYACRDWQEFKERADAAITEALRQLNDAHAVETQRERDQAELAELRRLRAEREEADRKAEAAAQAAEKARQEAEQKAAREAAEAEQRAEWQRKRDEQAERDVQAAVAAALAADRRIAEQKAAEEAAAEKRAASARRRAKVHTDIRLALTSPDIAPHVVDRIIDALAAGRIPHVSINY